MPKQKVYIKVEFLIEWTTKEERKEVLQALKNHPGSQYYGGGTFRFTKTQKPVTIIFPKKSKPNKS